MSSGRVLSRRVRRLWDGAIHDNSKTSKNRLHLDLRTPDLDAEVYRLSQLGATITDVPIIEHRWRCTCSLTRSVIIGDPIRRRIDSEPDRGERPSTATGIPRSTATRVSGGFRPPVP